MECFPLNVTLLSSHPQKIQKPCPTTIEYSINRVRTKQHLLKRGKKGKKFYNFSKTFKYNENKKVNFYLK